MMAEFHFIRPWWLLVFLPSVAIALMMLRQTQVRTAWNQVCDAHLLPYLIQTKQGTRLFRSWSLLFISLALMIISLAGPTWSRLPVPTFQKIQPRVVVLDMSDTMSLNDLTPDRLSRARFKLHDLFLHHDAGQFGLIVYTGEPFIVSPLTDDGQTIDTLLASLTPDIMPVTGQNLSSAIDEAGRLITQAGFQQGQILVLSASPPSEEAINMAQNMAQKGIDTSIIPVLGPDMPVVSSFEKLAKAGHGELITFSDTNNDIDQWLASARSGHQYKTKEQNDMPVWRDQGRWFLIPALLCLLPVWRRGWVQRLGR